jgi:hypothetical protein
MEQSEENDHQFAKTEESLASHQSFIRSSLGVKWIWLVLLVLAVATVLALALIRRSNSARNTDEASIANRSSNDHSPGSEVFLYLPGRSTVMVAVDEQSLDELIGALAERGEAVQVLVDSGKVLTVPNNTKVRVVDVNFAKIKVRFLEGKRVMTEAWVPERWIR